MLIFLIIGLILGAVVVIFALQNIVTISVAFLAWKFEGSLALILMITFASGILISLLISLPDTIRKHFQISGLKKQNDKLKQQTFDQNAEIARKEPPIIIVEKEVPRV